MDEQFYICTEKGKFDINMLEVEALRQKDLKSMQASFESNRDVRFPPISIQVSC